MNLAITVQLRAALKRHIRAFFEQRGYLEIDTPLAVICPGAEVHLRYFSTTWQDYQGRDHRLYLRSSPELHMKQAVAQGLPKVFQLAPCFRNGGEWSAWHHPEFTMLEWYEVGCSFTEFIDLTESLLQETYARMLPELQALALKPMFTLPARLPRLTVQAAFAKFANLELVDQDGELARKARVQGVESVRPDDDFETSFFKILIERIEPGLSALGGAILYDYPASQAALALTRDGVGKRFEVYLQRVELCNGFEELLTEAENRARIAAVTQQRQRYGYEVPEEDLDFYAALAKGLPACCGNALGFERWLALLMGQESLDLAVPFRRARIWHER